jgi:hypothetical protein
MTATTEAPAPGPTKQLEEALHAHFVPPQDRDSLAGAGAVYLTEVTAPESNRRADAVHVGLWQNRGAGRIDVCEIKTSRSDFLRELDQPAKAEAWWPYCTAFWLVVPHVSIAGPSDLPPGWGLMVPPGRGRRFKVVVKPEERTPRLTVPLLLTLLKNTETTRTNTISRLRRDHASDTRKREEKLRMELAGKADPAVRDRLLLLDKLEARLGLPLNDYPWKGSGIRPETAADALKEYAAGSAAFAEAQSDLRHRARELDQMAIELAKRANALRDTLRSHEKQLPYAAVLAAKEA